MHEYVLNVTGQGMLCILFHLDSVITNKTPKHLRIFTAVWALPSFQMTQSHLNKDTSPRCDKNADERGKPNIHGHSLSLTAPNQIRIVSHHLRQSNSYVRLSAVNITPRLPLAVYSLPSSLAQYSHARVNIMRKKTKELSTRSL